METNELVLVVIYLPPSILHTCDEISLSSKTSTNLARRGVQSNQQQKKSTENELLRKRGWIPILKGLEIGNPKSKMGNAGWFCWCLGGMRPSRSHGKKCNEMEMNFGLQRLRKNDKQGPAHNKSYTAWSARLDCVILSKASFLCLLLWEAVFIRGVCVKFWWGRSQLAVVERGRRRPKLTGSRHVFRQQRWGRGNGCPWFELAAYWL